MKKDPKALTKLDIERAADACELGANAKWTAIVGGREVPTRPVVLKACGELPNSKINSHKAVDIMKKLGFKVMYQGTPA
jgi:hypothetical protein